MILAIDVGNTNIVLGGIEDGRQRFSVRLASDRNKTADQYALDIQGILTMQKIKPEDIEGRDVTGGYIVRIDAFDSNDETFVSKVKGIQQQRNWMGGVTTVEANVTWTIYYPKKADLQPQQKAYIQSYVDSAELCIQSDEFADPEKGYAQLIDVSSFVDYFIHTEVSLNADGFKRSAYYYKEKDKKDGSRGLLFAGPVWDFNLAYGNCNFCNANNVQ